MSKIRNKVAESGLVTIDLKTYEPSKIHIINMEPLLFKGLILKEKEYRSQLREIDFSIYKDAYVCIENNTDAIIPVWAYMLLGVCLHPFTSKQFLGNQEEAREYFLLQNIQNMDHASFHGKRVIIKGCGEKPIETLCYLEATKQIMKSAISVMYGEACSAVPLFKKKVK